MNSSIAISFPGIIITILMMVIVGLIMLKIVAAVFGQVFSTSAAAYPQIFGKGSVIMPLLTFAAVIAVVAVARKRSDSTFQEAAKEVASQKETLRDSLQELKNARDQIRAAVRGSDAARAIASDTDDSSTTTTVAEATTVNELDAMERADRAAQVGTVIRSLLGSEKEITVAETTDSPLVQGAESEDGRVMLFSLTPQEASELFRESGPDVLRVLNSSLPDKVRGAYALIPLTPPVDAAVAPVKPLMAAGGLQTLADKLVTLLYPLTSSANNNEATQPPSPEMAANSLATPEPASSNPSSLATPASPVTPEPAVTPARAADITLNPPAWLKKPDGGRKVVRSKPLLSNEDADKALSLAINSAFREHLIESATSLDPAIYKQLDQVSLKLDAATAKLCVVDQFERVEELESAVEGPKTFRIAYALVEFPEAVDEAAGDQLRLSVQNDRIFAVCVSVGLGWLAMLTAGAGTRMWTQGTRLKKITAIPVLLLLTLPCFVGTFAIIAASSAGDGPGLRDIDESPLLISVSQASNA